MERRILYQPRGEEHLAPYAHARLNLTAHSEDAGELVRGFYDDERVPDYLCQRPGFTEKFNPLAD